MEDLITLTIVDVGDIVESVVVRGFCGLWDGLPLCVLG
jgi:hypothetical protein